MMTSKRVDEAAIKRLCDKITLTIKFVESAQVFPIGRQILHLVDAAAVNGDVRRLRLIDREVDAMTGSLSRAELDGLDALLRTRLGIDKDDERRRASDRVATILKRGTVASEKERQHLVEYATILETTGGDVMELEAVRALIASP